MKNLTLTKEELGTIFKDKELELKEPLTQEQTRVILSLLSKELSEKNLKLIDTTVSFQKFFIKLYTYTSSKTDEEFEKRLKSLYKTIEIYNRIIK